MSLKACRTQIDKLYSMQGVFDLGSACFEGHTSHTYIQSRFYRSPEVLIGVPYDSAIDMWSLGCVAAELVLGRPILPGVHEHDQLGRIREMIGPLPDRMVEQGYVRFCKSLFLVTIYTDTHLYSSVVPSQRNTL